MSIWHFPKLYVVKATKRKNEDNIPLAFVVPQNGKKTYKDQIQTAIKWAGEDREEVELENKPLSGFKIAKMVKRSNGNYFGSNNVVWRVEDPRGFEWEIPSGNLYELIQYCGIEAGGAIPQECYYGREQGRNILIPVGSILDEKSVDITTYKKEKEVFVDSKSINKIVCIKYDYYEPTYDTVRVNGKAFNAGWISAEFFLGKVKVCFVDGREEILYATVKAYAHVDENKEIVLVDRKVYKTTSYNQNLVAHWSEDPKDFAKEKGVSFGDLKLYKTFRVKNVIDCPEQDAILENFNFDGFVGIRESGLSSFIYQDYDREGYNAWALSPPEEKCKRDVFSFNYYVDKETGEKIEDEAAWKSKFHINPNAKYDVCMASKQLHNLSPFIKEVSFVS